MTDATRRFTDREVALVLRKAAEIEEARGGDEGARGLSRSDLDEIAREVGISPTALDQALRSLGRKPERRSLLSTAPVAQRTVVALPRELGRAEVAELVGYLDDRENGSGDVSEALGTVRWSTADRFTSTQVAITPDRGETSIQVVEKPLPRLRRLLTVAPPLWGAMLGGTIVSMMGVVSPTELVGGLAVGIAAGLGTGRLVWNGLARHSRRRVERLADALAARVAMRGAPGPAREPERLSTQESDLSDR